MSESPFDHVFRPVPRTGFIFVMAEAARAGFGALLGAVAGLMAELGVAILMVGWIVVRFVAA